MLRRVLVVLAVSILAHASARAAAEPAAAPVTREDAAAPSAWLRDPALSPDGTRVAFRFSGQIWIAPAGGGDAVPLTPGGVHAASPVWSPDGSTVAFAADRFGAMNIFAVPAAGGDAKRLTWNEHDQAPTGFTPDGGSVLFWSQGLGDASQTFPIPNGGEDGRQLYQVPLAGGRDTLVLPNAAMDARWDPAGTRLVYTGASIEQPFRRRQTSSAARQVWVYEAASGTHRRLTEGPHESRDAVWAPDGGVDYLDESSGSLNVWRRAPGLGHPEPLTQFTGDPVRSLSASRDGDLAFAWGGSLYRLRRGASAPERIAVRLVRAAFFGERSGRSTGFTDFAISPDGRDLAVVARGGISVASIDGRSVKRLHHTAGEERNPSFAPDGRHLAYASERDGRWDLYEASLVDPDENTFSQATRVTERRLTAGARDSMQPVYAPDGHHIAYVADRSAVRILDAAAGTDREMLPAGGLFSYDDWDWPLVFSPDSRWLALPVQPSLAVVNLAIAPADGSRPPVRLMPAGADQWSPMWSADGGLLTWLSDGDALHAAFQGRWLAELEGTFTSRQARQDFERRLMVPVAGDLPAAPGERDAPPGGPAGPTPDPRDAAGLHASPPRAGPSIELDGLDDRTTTLSQAPGQIVFGTLLDDGVGVLTVEQSSDAKGEGLVLTGTVRDMRRERRRTLFSGVPYQRDSPLRLARDHKHLYFLSRDGDAADGTEGLMEVDLARGTTRLIKITADTTHDEADARRAAFEQFWTLTKRRFYDPAFTGVDWDAARERYARFLPSLADARDLAELLSEMAGELAASHTGASYHPAVPQGERMASLGLYYDERYPGPGMKVAAAIAGGPFDAGDSALRPGDLIREVDGVPVPDEGGIRRLLRGHRKEVVAVTFEHPDGARVTEKRLTIDLARERDLADRRWVEGKRDAVAAMSCGRLGYVHLAAMDAESYAKAFSDVFGRFGRAEGLVVDVRDNGGGNLHNQLVTLLSGRSYFTVTPPRAGPSQEEPRDRWTKPSVVVMNAASYSDSSLFPLAYRDLHLGPLVGDPVAGTGTSVWWAPSRLVPGLVYGVPELPYREVDGTLSENHQVEPDLAVLSDPTAWARGEDPQLAAAVAALLSGRAGSCPARDGVRP